MRTVAEWAGIVISEVSPGRPVSAHIGEIGEPCASVEDAINAFGELARSVDINRFIPILILPLHDVAELVPVPPTWSETWMKGHLEPPSLAIQAVESRLCIENVEEYRCPMDSHPLVTAARGATWVAYYRCFRSMDARRLGWEYSRCVYIEAVLSQLIISV